MASPNAKKKADLKVVILGSASVGKTTFIHRYIEGVFKDTISTIGASFFLKQWGSYNVAIWDTAGEEKYSGLSSFYCRNAKAAILAFDVTSEDSFHSLRARFLPLLRDAEEQCLAVVIGTKVDLVNAAGESRREVSQQDAIQLAREANRDCCPTELPYFETSSLTGQGVARVFDYIFNTCLPPKQSLDRPGVVDLSKVGGASPPTAQARSGCGC